MSESTTSIELERLASSLIDLKARTGSVAPATLGVLASARLALGGLAGSAEELGAASLRPALERLAQLTEVWECLAVESPAATSEIAAFIGDAFDQMIKYIQSGANETRSIGAIVDESTIRWGDYLELIAPVERESIKKCVLAEPSKNKYPYDGIDAFPGLDGGSVNDLVDIDDQANSVETEEPAVDFASLLRMLGGKSESVDCENVEKAPTKLASKMSNPPLKPETRSFKGREDSIAEGVDSGSSPRVDSPESNSDDAPAIDISSLLQMLTGNKPTNKPANTSPSVHAKPKDIEARREVPGVRAESQTSSSAPASAGKKSDSFKNTTPPIPDSPGDRDRINISEKNELYRSSILVDDDSLRERRDESAESKKAEMRTIAEPSRPIPMAVEFAEIREAFLADSADILDRVEPLLAGLSASESSDFAENIAEFKRCLHTLKGAAGSVGLVDLGDLVHEVEDRLDGETIPLEARPAVVELLRGVVEYFEETLLDLKRGEIPRPPAESLKTAVHAPIYNIHTNNSNNKNTLFVPTIEAGSGLMNEPTEGSARSSGFKPAGREDRIEAAQNGSKTGAHDIKDQADQKKSEHESIGFANSGLSIGASAGESSHAEFSATSSLGGEGSTDIGEAVRRTGFAAVREASVRPTAGESEGLIRISGERIDELMDLASELLSRRGAWMGRVETLKSFAASAVQCRYRLTADVERLRDLTSDGRGRRSFGDDQERSGGTRRGGGEYGDLIRRLAEQTEDLAVLAGSARSAAESLADDGDALARLSLQLWNAIQAIRLVPARSLFQRLARVASEAARVEGRTIEIATLGDDLGVDRSLLDKAYEPLLHLTRNAVGHGIESAAERLKSGKPAAGRVTFEVRNESNTVVFKIHDDGRGLDYAAIEAKARRLGLLKEGAAASLERLNQIIFESGFSTREHSNAISGRGVGMDVVAKEAARLNGTISLASIPGRGTTFTIRLPARIALEQAMLARVGGVLIALPLESIELIDSLDAFKVEFQGVLGRGMIGGEMTTILDARGALPPAARSSRTCPRILLVRGEGDRIAVLVDAIEGPRELVVKPLSALLAGHPAIVGTSFSASGEIVYLLDPFGLARVSGGTDGPGFDRTGVGLADEKKRGSKANSVLVVDDSLSVRRVAARRLRELGFEVDEVSDGLEAVKTLRENQYKLILTDLEMPRMDGFALLGELERVGVSSSTPVVVASTRSDQATRDRVLARGAAAFVAKPIDARAWENVLIPLLGTPVDERSTSNLDGGRISEPN